MTKLPALSGIALVRILTRAGLSFVRQRGNHVSMQRGPFRTVIPLHDELAPGVVMEIIEQTGLSCEVVGELHS